MLITRGVKTKVNYNYDRTDFDFNAFTEADDSIVVI